MKTASWSLVNALLVIVCKLVEPPLFFSIANLQMYSNMFPKMMCKQFSYAYLVQLGQQLLLCLFKWTPFAIMIRATNAVERLP